MTNSTSVAVQRPSAFFTVLVMPPSAVAPFFVPMHNYTALHGVRLSWRYLLATSMAWGPSAGRLSNERLVEANGLIVIANAYSAHSRNLRDTKHMLAIVVNNVAIVLFKHRLR